MFSLSTTNTEIKGEIGYFKLQNWWLSSFTQKERDRIEEIFHPMGSNSNDKSLTEYTIRWTSQTATGFLQSLASWFNNPQDREIAKKIIAKAEELAPLSGDILDQHFTLQQKMQIYYPERETNPLALEKSISACKEQIALASKASKAFLKEYPNQPLPVHAGYSKLRIILEKQKKYDEAIELCLEAKVQGWNGDWDKQIETLKKKKEKLSHS